MKDYKLEKHEYLPVSVIASLLNEKQNYVLISNTNTGKTEACLKAAQESGQRFIFAVDTKILADQLGKKYGLPVYYAGKELPHGNCITLFNHIPYFKSPDTILFVDEFHSIIKDYGYKKDLIDNILNEFSNFKQVIGLTGTPLAKLSGFEDFRVLTDRLDRTINLFNYSSSYMDQLVYQVLKNDSKIHYISIFDKSNDAIEIAATLEANGIKKEEIAFLNSETKDSQPFKDIVNKNKTTNCKVVITTYTQGFNIEGKDHILHIIPKKNALHSLADIEQVVNRFRNETPVINMYWNHELEYKTSFNEIKQFEVESKEAKELIDSFLNSFKLDASNSLNPLQRNMLNNHLNAESLLNITMECKLNLVGIQHNVYSKKTREIYSDINYMEKELKAYSYKLNVVSTGNSIQTDSGKVNAIKESINQLKTALYKERLLEIHHSDTVDSLDELAMKYQTLLKYCTKDEAFNKLNNILFDKRKWNREVDVLTAKYSTNMINVILKENIYSSFTESKYSSKDILKKINIIHQKLGIPIVKTPTKATQILDKYFETKPGKIANGQGGRVSGRLLIKKLID